MAGLGSFKRALISVSNSIVSSSTHSISTGGTLCFSTSAALFNSENISDSNVMVGSFDATGSVVESTDMLLSSIQSIR